MQTMIKAALAAAVSLALGTGPALAGTAATRLPGEGAVANAASGGSATASLNAAGNQLQIALGGNTVIDWGGGAATATLNAGGMPGFDLGTKASVAFTGNYGVLNVDVSGNPSEIDGVLTGEGNVFVANQNGILVGPRATISSSAGAVGLIGNALGSFTFDGTSGSVAYSASGGDVRVRRGAGIAGGSVLIAGGGTVDVNVGGISAAGAITLQAGFPAASVAPGVAVANGTAAGGSAAAAAIPAIVLGGGSPVTVKGLAALAASPTAAAGALTSAAGRMAMAADGMPAGRSNPYVVVTGSNAGDVVLQSAGGAAISGTLNLDAASVVAGTLRNSGALTLAPGFGSDANGDLLVNAMVNTGTVAAGGAVFGSLSNFGTFDGGAAPLVVASSLTNAGSLTNVGAITAFGNVTNQGVMGIAGDLTLDDGNLANFGNLAVSNIFTTNGGVANYGRLVLTDADGEDIRIDRLDIGAPFVVVTSDATDPAFRAGADYSVTNYGSIVNGSPFGLLLIDANDSANLLSQVNAQGYAGANGSTGSFINRGLLAVGMPGSDPLALSAPANPRVFAYANNDITIGGRLRYSDGTAPSASAAAATGMGGVRLSSGAPNGVVTVATPVIDSEGVDISANQVAVDANVLAGLGATISAGDPPAGAAGFGGASGYSVYLAPGVTLATTPGRAPIGTVSIEGRDRPDGDSSQPNVFIGGTVSGNIVQFQGSDLYTGPSGRIVATGTNPLVTMEFTGDIGAAPSWFGNGQRALQNYLPIADAGQGADGSTPPLTLVLNPMAYFFATGGTPVGPSSADILVDGDVNFIQNTFAAPVVAGGSAAAGSELAPNIPLTLQSTGNITTQYTSYWPGAVTFATIGSSRAGYPLAGTLGSGVISLGGSFSNVLPGSVAGHDGMRFLTASPLLIPAGDTIATNANADIEFGTPALASGYASGALSPGVFFGGTLGANGVVTYGPLPASRFRTYGWRRH